MKSKHFLLAILTVVIWGVNFIAIHIGLKGFPPFLLCALRFGLAAFPWIFFFSRPKSPLKLILGYGIFTFALQFGLLFCALYVGLSPGLSSLVIQVQVFFSMFLSAMFFKDRPSSWKIIGALISFIGVGIVASHVGAGTSLIGLVLALCSAFAWAAGNMFSKKVAADSPLALVVWGNMIAFPLMLVFSYFIEGPELILNSFQHVSLEVTMAILYTVLLSTMVGYGLWGYLLNTYSTGVVVPFTLLVPVVGLLSSAFYLAEVLPVWKLLACFFIMTGLIFNLLEKQIRGIVPSSWRSGKRIQAKQRA